LKTGPNPPSPILKAISKLLVAALICRKENNPGWKSKPFSSVDLSKNKYIKSVVSFE
jgi:hypothetical protein